MAKIRVYLDNCAYNRPFDDQAQIKIALETDAKKYVQRLIIVKAIDLVYSYVNRLENDNNPFATRKNAINAFFEYAAFYVDSTNAEFIEKKAAGIMKSGIKARDALHIACSYRRWLRLFHHHRQAAFKTQTRWDCRLQSDLVFGLLRGGKTWVTQSSSWRKG